MHQNTAASLIVAMAIPAINTLEDGKTVIEVNSPDFPEMAADVC